MNTNSLIIRDSVPKDHKKKKKLGGFLTLGSLGCAQSEKKLLGCAVLPPALFRPCRCGCRTQGPSRWKLRQTRGKDDVSLHCRACELKIASCEGVWQTLTCS